MLKMANAFYHFLSMFAVNCCGCEMLRIEKEGKNGNYPKGFLLKKLNQLDPIFFEELNRKEKTSVITNFWRSRYKKKKIYL
jgi:hypothetical protein